jgi:hypothetical protein
MTIKIDFNPHRGLQRILDQLPGRTCLLDVSSVYPKDIITRYKDIIEQHDSIMFYNEDVWRYSTDPELLNFYQSYPNKQFYIQHLGHDNRWLTDNCREFSIPFLIKADMLPTVPLKNSAHWGFASLNNRPSYARLLMGYHLWQAGVLDRMVYSQNTSMDPEVPLLGGYTRVLLDSLPNVSDYLDLLPIQWKDDILKTPPNNHTQNEYYNTFRFYDHDAYDQAWCFITTETETEWWGFDQSYPTPIATEKTFKPFYSGQVGLWLVAPGHFAWLRQHGMIMYEDLVGEDYDSKNTEQKIHTIVDVVQRGDDFIADYYDTHRRELLHNQQLMLTGKFESSIMSAVETFLFD